MKTVPAATDGTIAGMTTRGIRYAVGGRVRVQVSRVDLDGRKIDFRVVREGEGERPQVRGDKARAPGSAVEELASVRATDRAVKTASRSARSKGAAEGGTRSRKPGAQRPSPKPRTRR